MLSTATGNQQIFIKLGTALELHFVTFLFPQIFISHANMYASIFYQLYNTVYGSFFKFLF